MAYENLTQKLILERMLESVSSNLDKREGSIVHDMLSPASIELALAYIEMDNLLNLSFADTTYGEYLDLRVGELGLTRKPSVKASGQVTFSGVNGTVIPVGTRISTDDTNPLYFVTTQEGVINIGGVAIVSVEAEDGGEKWNVLANTITVLVDNILNIDSVNNLLDLENGEDAETDESLLTRYKERILKPATSGNRFHYEQWAKEVAGVGDVKVFPLWNGNGTVKVCIINTDKVGASTELVTSATTYIELMRPVGATVTVVSATEIPIDITGTLTLESEAVLADVVENIQNGIVTYLKNIAFKESIVRYSQIANIILDTDGVVDYSNLAVNGGTSNITVADTSVAVIGTVTLT